jgi:hypothetical protein
MGNSDFFEPTRAANFLKEVFRQQAAWTLSAGTNFAPSWLNKKGEYPREPHPIPLDAQHVLVIALHVDTRFHAPLWDN